MKQGSMLSRLWQRMFRKQQRGVVVDLGQAPVRSSQVPVEREPRRERVGWPKVIGDKPARRIVRNRHRSGMTL